MEDLIERFDKVPLPYKYVNVPQEDATQNSPRVPLYYYVNKVITNLTRAGFKHAGFKPTSNERKWNASWGRQYQADQYKECQCWQKINHFAGAFLMGRKDNLDKRMKELAARGEGLADFYPESFLLPAQQNELNKKWLKVPYWIVKPSASSRGRGIHILVSKDSPVPTDPGIVQTYIDHPMLITRRKFDIRLYALIPSIDPIRIYMHKNGMARFCTHEYDPNSDPTDPHMHITNFSINKEDANFHRPESDEESIEDSKWSIQFFMQHLESQGIDTKVIQERLEAVTISTVIAGMMEIRKHHQRLIPHRHTSYEMYGIDIMFDDQLMPHLIEINISPSMSGLDSKLDQNIKYPLQLDLLRMARIIECDASKPHPCPGVEMIDERWRETATPERVKEVLGGADAWENPNFGDYVMIRDYIEEQSRLGGFHRIFPKRKTMNNFLPCFEALSYRDTVFQQWILRDHIGRRKALDTNWDMYTKEMMSISEEAKIFK